MKKAFALFISLVLVIILSACWNNNDSEGIDICQDAPDCYILSNEDVRVIAQLHDDEYLEMSNKELEQVNEITASYFFNYFEEDASTLSNEKKINFLNVFDQFDNIIDYYHVSGSLYNFMLFQRSLIGFEIETLSENNIQFMEIEDREHVVYKSDISVITYLIKGNGDTDEYEFDLTTNTISNIDLVKNYNSILNDLTQNEGITFTKDYFSFVYSELYENTVIEKDISFMNKHGFYAFSTTTFGDLNAKRTYPVYLDQFDVISTSFQISYSEETSLFEFYNNNDKSYSYVSYSEFFNTALNHPNLDEDILAWCNQEFTESELIELFTLAEDTTN